MDDTLPLTRLKAKRPSVDEGSNSRFGVLSGSSGSEATVNPVGRKSTECREHRDCPERDVQEPGSEAAQEDQRDENDE